MLAQSMNPPVSFPQPDSSSPNDQRSPAMRLSGRPAPGNPKRPKLSLQTTASAQPAASRPFSGLTTSFAAADSPTTLNTQSNALKSPSSPRSSRGSSPARSASSTLSVCSTLHPPSSSTSASSISSSESPAIPYALPLGARSILRNSPLPPRHISTTSRTPKRMFTPTKRVLFSDALVELLPTPIIEGSDESDTEGSRKHDLSEADLTNAGGTGTPIQSKRRRRDWVWTLPTKPGDPSTPNADAEESSARPSSPASGHLLREDGATGARSVRDSRGRYLQTPIAARQEYSDEDESEDDRAKNLERTVNPAAIPLPETPATPATMTPLSVGSTSTPIIRLPIARRRKSGDSGKPMPFP